MLPWYASVLAEAWLAWRVRTTGWGRFLLFDIGRAVALLTIPARSFWYAPVWLATEPVSLVLQFAAVAPILTAGMRTDGRLVRWLFYAAGACGAIAGLWPDSGGFEVSHRAMLALRRIAVALLLAGLLISAAIARYVRLPLSQERCWLIAYYVLQAGSIILMGNLGPELIRPLNQAHAAIAAALFLFAAFQGTFRERHIRSDREGGEHEEHRKY